MKKPAAKAAQFEVPTQKSKLFGRRAAHDDRGALPSVLHPVGSQAVADAQKGFSRVLGELQQPGNPSGLTKVSLMLDMEEPLEGKRLHAFGHLRHGRGHAGQHDR